MNAFFMNLKAKAGFKFVIIEGLYRCLFEEKKIIPGQRLIVCLTKFSENEI